MQSTTEYHNTETKLRDTLEPTLTHAWPYIYIVMQHNNIYCNIIINIACNVSLVLNVIDSDLCNVVLWYCVVLFVFVFYYRQKSHL